MSSYKRLTLEKRLAQLLEEYEACSMQMVRTLDAVDRVRLTRQIRDLQSEIAAIEHQLSVLTGEPAHAEAQWDVFISYARADKRWVSEWLLPRLRDAGLSVAIDVLDFRPGESIDFELRRLIRGSARALLVITPDYLASAWSRIEKAFLRSELDVVEEKAIPLLLRECPVPGLLAGVATADFTDPDERETQLVRLLDALRTASKAGPESATAATTSYDVAEIREFLRHRFTLPQLEMVCMDAHLDLSEMRTGSRDTFALDIATQAQRMSKIADLVRAMELQEPMLQLSGWPGTAWAQGDQIRRFLGEVGFNIVSLDNPKDFIAKTRRSSWYQRFRKGLYVRVELDSVLDQEAVQSVYRAARPHTDHALVVINRQPSTSAWMTIGGLRVDESHPYVILPIDDSSIREMSAQGKDAPRRFKTYIESRLGKEYDPYEARDPVSDAINFFGRASLVSDLTKGLKLGQRLGLFGIHKMGKSSVLKRLQKQLDFPVAYVYLRENESLASICRRTMEAWSDDVRVKYERLNWSMPQFDPTDPQGSLERSIKDLLNVQERLTDSPRLAVLLDEIDAIVPNKVGDYETLRRYLDLMGLLRGLQQETEGLALLVAGIHPGLARVNYFWGDQKNPMHQVIMERFLEPLDVENFRVMICSLGEQIGLTYDEDTVNYLYEMTGGHPFLGRQLCSLALREFGDTGRVPQAIVCQVASDFVRDPSRATYFDESGLWNELSQKSIWGEEGGRSNRELLCALAASTDGLSELDLCSLTDPVSDEKAFFALRERSIIHRLPDSNRYGIRIRLFRNWICRNKLLGV